MAGESRPNPVTSEAEAFRWLLVIAAGAATVIAVALLIAPVVGAIWGLILILVGCLYVWRMFRRPKDSGQVTRGGDGRYRVLVLANQTVRSPTLLGAIRETTAGRNSEVLLIVPALVAGGPEPASPALSVAREHARQRMELTLQDLAATGCSASGRVGGKEPNRALHEALNGYAADEVIVSTLVRERSHWLEQGVVERARIEIDIPVRHVVCDDVG